MDKRKLKIGPANHQWNGGVSRKWKVRNRKKYCEVCKSSTKKLCIHHIDHDQSNNLPSNLMTLCWSCHRRQHILDNPSIICQDCGSTVVRTGTTQMRCPDCREVRRSWYYWNVTKLKIKVLSK